MGTATIDASNRGKSTSPPKANKSSPQPDAANVKTETSTKNDGASNAEATKPLAPPPRPGQQQQQGGASPDYFSQPGGGSLSLEPNPFEQSFGGNGQPETPGGTKLPSVHTLTSPSSLLPGNNATPFNWGGGSLRTGPLSPAMLSGPANDYFGDTTHHLRGGFPTPNESGLRSGLTPGGSGSMFPAPSPNSQAFIAQLASGGATPSTLDFHRTAMSAAAKREQKAAAGGNQQQQSKPQQSEDQAPQQAATSQPQDMANGTTQVKAEPKSFDPHDNDAANGLFMLAQGRNGAQGTNQYAATSAPSAHSHPAPSQAPHMNGGPVDAGRGMSEDSNMSNQSEPKANARGKGKKNPPATNGRRKAEDPPAKAPPTKKAKNSVAMKMSEEPPSEDDEDDDKGMDGSGKSKMTDEEKRKNFLERNRVAALKCRQRKKQWLANLQTKVEMFSNENEALTAQITQLREEVVNLKTLLLAHKDCPVTQQTGMHGAFMNQVGQVPPPDPYNSQMNPYQMAGHMQNQQIMNGQAVNRRYS